MSPHRFALDGVDRGWTAIRFGESWNGFLTPVVSRETLVELLNALGEGHRWEGKVAVVWPTVDLAPGDEHDGDLEDRLLPDREGNYDLGVLGWVFVSETGLSDGPAADRE